jgi:hypothetical protein
MDHVRFGPNIGSGGVAKRAKTGGIFDGTQKARTLGIGLGHQR